jgi:hypothetical protein
MSATVMHGAHRASVQIIAAHGQADLAATGKTGAAGVNTDPAALGFEPDVGPGIFAGSDAARFTELVPLTKRAGKPAARQAAIRMWT